jgi:hypothetical protein
MRVCYYKSFVRPVAYECVLSSAVYEGDCLSPVVLSATADERKSSSVGDGIS